MLKEFRCFLLLWLSSFIGLFSICFFNKEVIYQIISAPLTEFLKKPLAEIFIYTSLFESFVTDIFICCYSSCLLSLPVLAVCVYLFLRKSLFDNEKRILKRLLFCSGLLACFATVTTYYFVFPRAVVFFLDIKDTIAVPMLKISDYVSTFFHIIFGVILVFQLPIVMVGLVRFGVIKPSFLTENRRIAIVVIFIVSAVITPPDVISQVICAGVLMFLYELTNFYIKSCFSKKAEKTKRKTLKKIFDKDNKTRSKATTGNKKSVNVENKKR